MIKSAEEFKEIYDLATGEERDRLKEPADDAVWLDIIHKYPELEIEILNNHTISSKVLERLASSKDPDVRFDVASKRRNTRETFELLARDPVTSVRHCVACNAKTPREILIMLASDSAEAVAQSAIKRL